MLLKFQRIDMSKVYDCFQFFNELDLLEIRLNELNTEVDYFVIVEAELSHQLKPKPLYFLENKERYSKFLDKIIHVVVPAKDFYTEEKEQYTFYNDILQRNRILEGIIDAKDDDLIVISDLDEIVSESALNKVKIIFSYDQQPLIFEQPLYYWFLNTRANGYMWTNAGICTKKTLNSLGTQSFKDNIKCKQFKTIKNGGWHFSYVGTPDKAKIKLDNYAHKEFSHLTENQLKTFRENLSDPLGRTNEGINLVVDPINTMPVYVQNNIEKFKDLIR